MNPVCSTDIIRTCITLPTVWLSHYFVSYNLSRMIGWLRRPPKIEQANFVPPDTARHLSGETTQKFVPAT
jgi:hypothetical protein